MKNESMNLSPQDARKLESFLREKGYTIVSESNESEEWTSGLEYDTKGKIKQSNNNCALVLENDPLLAGAIKRNELSGGIDTAIRLAIGIKRRLVSILIFFR